MIEYNDSMIEYNNGCILQKKYDSHDLFLSVSYQSEEQMGNKEYSGAIEQERYIIFLTNQ